MTMRSDTAARHRWVRASCSPRFAHGRDGKAGYGAISGHRHVDYHRPDDPTSQRQPHRGGAHSDPSVTAASGSISLTPQVPSGVMTIIDGALSVRVRPDFSQVINYTLGVSLLLVSMVEP